ncbi:MAG: leucine-rich repeat protein [Malacoplasma sp.]|nr:leucine-rich repeat protein [Malacoplasma sp.]
MKKIKLLTTLSSLGVLVTSAPIVVTGCNEKEETPFKSTVTSDFPEVNILSNDSEEKEFTFDCQFFDKDAKEIEGTAKWEMDMPKISSSDKVSITQNDNKIKVKVDGWTSLNEIKEYKVVVKGQSTLTQLTGINLGTRYFVVRVLPYNKNIIKYNEEQYQLASDINPTLFENIANGTNLPKTDGTDLLIEDTNKIQGLSLQSVSSEWNKEIGDYFLFDGSGGIENLGFVDLSGLKEATKIGDEFLQYAPIRIFDASMFTEIEKIGTNAFDCCNVLESLIFKNNEKLNEIGANFCYWCLVLHYVDLSGWTSVEYINQYFMYDCTNLKEIDLSSLTSVIWIDICFMYECFSLESIDLSGLTNVEYIGNYFMSYCTSLEEIDLNPLTNLNNPDGDYKDSNLLCDWFYYSTSLKRIIWNKETSLKNVNDDFPSYYCNYCCLREIDLSGWVNVENIGDSFIAYAGVLQYLDLSGLKNLKTIGSYFLSCDSELKELWLPNDHVPTTFGGWDSWLFSLEKIHCGSQLDSYKNAAGWSDLKDLMVE